MITIKPIISEDASNATKTMTEQEVRANAQQHIKNIQQGMRFFIEMLQVALTKHDQTKMDHFNEYYKDFQAKQKGDTTPFEMMNWFSSIHLVERHHSANPPEDINLIDVLDQICDKVIDGMGKQGKPEDDVYDSTTLKKAYDNTVELLRKNVKVQK